MANRLHTNPSYKEGETGKGKTRNLLVVELRREREKSYILSRLPKSVVVGCESDVSANGLLPSCRGGQLHGIVSPKIMAPCQFGCVFYQAFGDPRADQVTPILLKRTYSRFAFRSCQDLHRYCLPQGGH